MPPEVEDFFDSVQNGNWAEAKARFVVLATQRHAGAEAGGIATVWPAVADTYGVVDLATTWPAAEILAYGESVRLSLSPGSILLSSTAASQSIPAFLPSDDSAPLLVLCPASLSDSTYLDYLDLAYPDTFGALDRSALRAVPPGDSDGDGDGAADPASHPGRLLQALIGANPGSRFAVDGASSWDGLEAQAVPKGPFLELQSGASEAAGEASQAAADDVPAFWEETALRLETASNLAPDSPTRAHYAELGLTQARLLAANKLDEMAMRAFQSVSRLAPASYRVLEARAAFLLASGYSADVPSLLADHARANPDQAEIVEDIRKRLKVSEDR